ncbi:MAG: DNA alkylation repair protein [Chloroflexi bacterium]|jgi:hypothetical protein|nr:DNA alkylation repair protein [Chloroflexota bacterium]
MDTGLVLEELRRLGKPATAAIYRRHGAHDETWGVTFADLGRLEKALRGRSDLAGPLWDTAVHEARYLATRIADAHAMPITTIEGWLAGARDRGTAAAVADLAARRDDARALALEWVADPDEFVGYAGWTMVATLAMADRLDDACALALAERVRDTIHRAPNMTRHAMTMAIIGIGIACPALRELVYAAARAIGTVVVDHGKTGCVTPAIVPYVERAVARQAARRLGHRARTPRPSPPRTRLTESPPAVTGDPEPAGILPSGRD